MPIEDALDSWETIERLVHDKAADELRVYLATLSSAEVARAVTRIDEEEQAALLTLLGPEDAADLLEELVDLQGADLLEELSPEHAAAIFDEMDSSHRADVLAELDEDEAEAILEKMDPEEAQDARQLLTYPEDSAGGIMITEYLSYHIDLKVSDVLADLRENAERYSDYGVQYAYVLSESDTLVGVVRLRDLLLTPSGTPLTAVMIANPLYLHTDATLDELDQFFDRYPFVGVPITDHYGRMMGVVRRGDAEEACSERAEQALMRFGGIIGGEELRSMSALSRASRRLAWLIINLGLSLLPASVILRFQDSIQASIQAKSTAMALIFFLPIIGNMSGCSGNQAVAVSIRELTLGMIKPEDFLRVLRKEIQVAAIIGLTLGFTLGTGTCLVTRNLCLGLIVGCALAANSIVSLSLGGLIPLLLRRFKLDPALAAPLIVTTLSDMTGFFIFLSLAALVLARGLL